jgi:transposase InsO family protein
VYHVNLVDEVLQWELVVCVERISERFLVPALEAVLEQFPFALHGFHADNGSEFINYQVARILEKLRMELTKSRPRHSNDNGLIETKNGSIIRKLLGYGHIPQQHAGTINQWYQQWLNVYVNFHRPCAFGTEIVVNEKTGKRKRVYRREDYQTPYEKLRSLPNAEQSLRPGVTFEQLDALAYAHSDTEFAAQMQEAKHQLFSAIRSTHFSSPDTRHPIAA